MAIVVSGAVGTGKTTLAKKLAKVLKCNYIDVNKVIKDEGLKEKYDKKRKTWEVDIKKLNSALVKVIKKDRKVVIDSHMAHLLPKKYVDVCIITKCDLKTLEKRLKKRKYSKLKIKENLEAEIFDVCFTEAKEKGHDVKVIDTSKGINRGLFTK